MKSSALTSQGDLLQYLQAFPVSVFLFETDGRGTFLNKFAKKEFPFLNARKFSITDLTKYVLIVGDKPFTDELCVVKEVARTKKPVKNLQIVMNSQPHRQTYLLNAAPILKNKSIHKVLLILENVTDEFRKQDIENLFIKTLGHELRQPLALVVAYSYYLKKFLQRNQPEATKYLKKIEAKIQQISQMLDDITDVSRLSFSNFKIYKVEISLKKHVRQILTELRTMNPTRQVNFEDRIPDEEVKILADRVRLRQIIMNLMNNALKYSPEEAPVTLLLEREKDAVRILIQDHGMGISEEEQSEIFKPFYRSKNALTHSQQGLGLGLALVKHLVTKHRGMIEVKSRQGEGTTFVVTLPLNLAKNEPLLKRAAVKNNQIPGLFR